MKTSYAWLIEHGGSTTDQPDYFAGFDGMLHFKWTRNHNEAVRFSRRVDAEAVARGDRLGDKHRVCEHGWDEGAAGGTQCREASGA